MKKSIKKRVRKYGKVYRCRNPRKKLTAVGGSDFSSRRLQKLLHQRYKVTAHKIECQLLRKVVVLFGKTVLYFCMPDVGSGVVVCAAVVSPQLGAVDAAHWVSKEILVWQAFDHRDVPAVAEGLLISSKGVPAVG